MRGIFLKKFRIKNQIKQYVLAQKLEISNTKLSLYENGKLAVPNTVWKKFIEIYSNIIPEEIKSTYLDEEDSCYERLDTKPNLFLKKFRKKYGLTQNDLALKLEVSVSYISSIEVGVNEITETVINKFLDVYNYLLSDTDIMELYSYLKKDKDLDENNSNSFGNIGAYLVEFRHKNNIKQIEIAQSLGVSSQFLSKIEYGKTKFPYELFNKFLSIYKGKITEEDKSKLYNYISKQNSNIFNNTIQNFILSNDLSYIFYDLANIKLEKEQVQYLCLKLLDEAKTLKKEL